MKDSVHKISFVLILLMASACDSMTGTSETTITNKDSKSLYRFASGTKSVKIITSTATGGSFSAPTAVPTITPVPSPFPGNGGTASYVPGVSAVNFYDLDGVTSIVKPSWLHDFQVGITSTSSATACAAFAPTSGSSYGNGYYRVSEHDCGSVANGVGGNADPVFLRVILNRDYSEIGSAENLMMQIEYQASGLRLNSDGISTNPEDNLDQLWKIFTHTTLAFGTNGSPFSIFIPPNYASCEAGGTGDPGPSTGCAANSNGAPVTVKQVLIPLSSNSEMSVVQLTRVKGRVNNAGSFPAPSNDPVNYVNSFCSSSDSPFCLGVVIRSVTLMRL